MVAFLVSAAITGLVITIFYLGGIYGAMFPKKFLGDDPEESIEEIIKKKKNETRIHTRNTGLSTATSSLYSLLHSRLCGKQKKREKKGKTIYPLCR
jgi:hypothetical protein